MKKIIKKVHVWLGFISGIFIFLIAFSGCIYIFNDEIIEFANQDAIYISEKEQDKISIENLLSIVESSGYVPQQFVYSKAANRSVYILSTDTNNRFVQIYIDPYTGNILKTSNLYEFFYFVESFHTELCMGAFGRAFIGIITVIFLILTLTGLSLSLRRKWTKKHSE